MKVEASARKTFYIAIGPFCWGKADSPVEAVNNCKKEAPKKGSPYYSGPFRCILFSVNDPDAYVDGMGSIVRRHDAEVVEVERIGRWDKEATR